MTNTLLHIRILVEWWIEKFQEEKVLPIKCAEDYLYTRYDYYFSMNSKRRKKKKTFARLQYRQKKSIENMIFIPTIHNKNSTLLLLSVLRFYPRSSPLFRRGRRYVRIRLIYLCPFISITIIKGLFFSLLTSERMWIKTSRTDEKRRARERENIEAISVKSQSTNEKKWKKKKIKSTAIE